MKEGKRHRRWVVVWVWLVASLTITVAVYLLVPLLDPDVRALAAHPVRTRATVIDTFIDGWGGDPAVDYTYRVGGRWYTGWGDGGGIGTTDPLSLHQGDHILVEYAASRPSASCRCDVRTSDVQISESPVLLFGDFAALSSLICVMVIAVAGVVAVFRRGKHCPTMQRVA